MRHMLCSLLQGIYIDTTDDMCKEMISPVVMYMLLVIEIVQAAYITKRIWNEPRKIYKDVTKHI